MRLLINNSYSQIEGIRDRKLQSRLIDLCGFRVEGCWFSPAYRSKSWDGKIRLMKKTSKGLRFPTGLIYDVLKALLLQGINLKTIDIEDKRRQLGQKQDLPWLSNIELRDYQNETVEKAMGENWPINGRGILRLPIRSGKTVVAAKLFHLYKLRGVFVATSQLILRQTVRLFREIFGSECVGVIGDNDWEPKWITIATIQSLEKKSKRVKEFLNKQDILIVDEVHHMEGDSWRKPIIDCNARYKFGLSATVKVNRQLCPKSAIYLQAATGPLLYSIPISRLVKDGWLMNPQIFVQEINSIDNGSWSESMYYRNIVNNHKRNEAIIKAARILSKQHTILVDVGRLAHIKILYQLAIKAGLNTAVVHYKTDRDRRIEILEQWKRKEIKIVIGTILGEGVDIPELSVVINAEGGQSWISCIQRLRNLTIHPDKKDAILIDYYDFGNSYLERHSKARLKTYSQEESFRILGPYKEGNFLIELENSMK
jgi:superfamily II DNA or RNA helicase